MPEKEKKSLSEHNTPRSWRPFDFKEKRQTEGSYKHKAGNVRTQYTRRGQKVTV